MLRLSYFQGRAGCQGRMGFQDRTGNQIETVVKAATKPRRRLTGISATMLACLLTSAVQAQVGYTFTSGPFGDGFDWPASPTGILDGDYFLTPDGIEFDNYFGNNMFFDNNWQVIGNASGFADEALWGNPLDNSSGYLDLYFYDYSFDNGFPGRVSFNFAWSMAGPPGTTPDYVYIYVEDSEGRATEQYFDLTNTFTGFGGVDGYSGPIVLDAENLYDDFEGVDDGPFLDIAYVSIEMYDIATLGASSEFGIDFFDVDGFFGVDSGEVYPSVNNGAFDVTGSTLGNSWLRGTGTATHGLEVTNSDPNSTTFSTVLDPNGDLTDLGQIMNAVINGGESIYNPDLVSIDRSMPSAAYRSDITVVNNGNPLDPDNTCTLQITLYEPPVLNTPSPVDVSAGEFIELSNAAAPVNGYRATAEVTGSSVTGPFNVTPFAINTPVKPNELIDTQPTLNRYGLLSGPYNGSFTLSLAMTAYAGVNNDIEIYLSGAEPVADETWVLNADLQDDLADLANFDPNIPLGPGLVGTNSTTTAVTLLGGDAAYAGDVSIGQGAGLSGTSTGIIGDAALINFSGAIPAHVVQFTYRDVDLCSSIVEGNLEVLRYNSSTSDWEPAILGNSDGGSGATLYVGSFADFQATLSGAPISTALSTYGIDAVNNHVWAIVDHQADFGVGEAGVLCENPADCDGSGTVDLADFNSFNGCANGPSGLLAGCGCFDFDLDSDVDMFDYATFQQLLAQ